LNATGNRLETATTASRASKTRIVHYRRPISFCSNASFCTRPYLLPAVPVSEEAATQHVSTTRDGPCGTFSAEESPRQRPAHDRVASAWCAGADKEPRTTPAKKPDRTGTTLGLRLFVAGARGNGCLKASNIMRAYETRDDPNKTHLNAINSKSDGFAVYTYDGTGIVTVYRYYLCTATRNNIRPNVGPL